MLKDKQILNEYIFMGVLGLIILIMVLLIGFSGHENKLYVSFSKVKEWGRVGVALGQMAGPEGVALGPDGSVWVAERNNHRIQKFSLDGQPLMIIGKKVSGTAQLQFSSPDGVAVDKDGTVYVADTWNHRIQKISKNGKFLTWWGTKKWGVGVGPGEFFGPRGVAVDAEGNVYVADTGNHRIEKFTSKGKLIKMWGQKGAADDQLNEPVGIAVDNKGYVFVADTHNRAVKKFTTDGVFVTKWPIDGWNDLIHTVAGFLCVDNAGKVYVSDPVGQVLFVYNEDGAYVGEWSKDAMGSGAFFYPSGVAADAKGDILVADGNNRIQKFAR